MWLFRILFAIGALAVLVLAYFFVDGLQYSGAGGSSLIWLPILAVPVGILIAAWNLRASGRNRLALSLLAVLALPPVIFVLFFGILLMTNPSWH